MHLKILFLLFITLTASAGEVTDEITSQVKSIASLYGDGQAGLVEKSIQVREVTELKGQNCVTLVSFYMGGFSGGNNTSQFIVFLKCRGKVGDVDPTSQFNKSVIGIHPFYHHRNKYDIHSARYENRVITIASPKGEIEFTNRYSIWWSQREQKGI